MSKLAQYEILAGLKEAQQRFADWRSSHSGRRPIPEPLWALAAELASYHGVFRTAQVLRLDYTKLRSSARGGGSGRKAGVSAGSGLRRTNHARCRARARVRHRSGRTSYGRVAELRTVRWPAPRSGMDTAKNVLHVSSLRFVSTPVVSYKRWIATVTTRIGWRRERRRPE
jgi:hypothetical protein